MNGSGKNVSADCRGSWGGERLFENGAQRALEGGGERGGIGEGRTQERLPQRFAVGKVGGEGGHLLQIIVGGGGDPRGTAQRVEQARGQPLPGRGAGERDHRHAHRQRVAGDRV